MEGYGLTETTMACTCTPFAGKWKQGSVGMPLPDVVVRIGDIETGEGEMPASKEGEIIFRAPQLTGRILEQAGRDQGNVKGQLAVYR